MDHESPPEETISAPPNPGLLARIRKWVKRAIAAGVSAFTLYGIIVLLGLIPVNNDFEETKDGIEIFVFSGEFHSDIILPVENEICDWRSEFSQADFQTDVTWASHIGFGWGDREFYINTPSWKDLKVSTAINALLVPSQTVVHVAHTNQPMETSQIKSVTISNEQYKRLVAFVKKSFVRDKNECAQLIPGEAYGFYDAFYIGSGNYHSFRTCNCWVGEALQETGVKTGWFTPLPKTVFLYFP